MDKRFQVFISSTFADLQEERREVIQAILELNCFPAGMELFPASNDEQFQFIKKVIDDSDYYLLIIGGRYGSVSAEGISYIESEFDYAVSRGIPILTFVHGAPEQIPAGKYELDPSRREALERFRKRAMEHRLAKKWQTTSDLVQAVILALSKAFRDYTAVGWTRGSQFANDELLEQINALRIENEKLRNSQTSHSPHESSNFLSDLAFGDEKVELKGQSKLARDSKGAAWSQEMSWNKVFSLLGPKLFSPQNYHTAKSNFSYSLKTELNRKHLNEFQIDDDVFQTIKVQLLGLNLIQVAPMQTTNGGVAEFLSLTKPGIEYLIKIKGVTTNPDEIV